MANVTENTMTSAELGILWLRYQNKTLMIQMTKHFESKSNDQRTKDILRNYYTEEMKIVDTIKTIFENEKAIVPQGFGNQDVFNDAPLLFDDIFCLMFLRNITKIALGLDGLHVGMSFRKDIRNCFKDSVKADEDIYEACTDYLAEQGVLTRPPSVIMPKEVEFIEDEKYMSGIQFLGNKRALNSVEVAYLFNILESNVIGMQLMSGFAQVAKEKEVREYFDTGRELAKKIVSDISGVFLQSDIQPPNPSAGKATDSTVPPFSDKLMMFLSNLLSSFGLGGESLGMAFSMRSDIPAKLAVIAKDTLDFAREGGKIMIQHKWLEEPPQMIDRNQLISGKQ